MVRQVDRDVTALCSAVGEAGRPLPSGVAEWRLERLRREWSARELDGLSPDQVKGLALLYSA